MINSLFSVLTTANGINPRGDIVGHYDDPDGTTYGYRLSKGFTGY